MIAGVLGRALIEQWLSRGVKWARSFVTKPSRIEELAAAVAKPGAKVSYKQMAELADAAKAEGPEAATALTGLKAIVLQADSIKSGYHQAVRLLVEMNTRGSVETLQELLRLPHETLEYHIQIYILKLASRAAHPEYESLLKAAEESGVAEKFREVIEMEKAIARDAEAARQARP